MKMHLLTFRPFPLGVMLAVLSILRALDAAPAGAARAYNPQSTNGAPSPSKPPLQIRVDPRVELLSVLFRLAGNPEYNQGKVPTYTADVEKQFGPFREHAAVRLARKLRQSHGVSYDACMSMAVHLTDVDELQTIVPLSPWPAGLDRRWTPDDVEKF